MNQVISSSFAARTLGIPYFGIFGACSSSMEGLSLAAQLIESKAAKYVITAASSHNAAAENNLDILLNMVCKDHLLLSGQ